MSSKEIRVYFYNLHVLNLPEDEREDEYLWSLFLDQNKYINKRSKVIGKNSNTGKSFELRDIQIVGNVVQGCLAMLRDDPPHLRDSSGEEAQLPMKPGETLLEKNHFLYFKKSKLLIWQFNLQANHVNNFSIIMTALTGQNQTVSHSMVIKDDFCLNDSVELEYVDFAVSAPRKKSQHAEILELNPNDWSLNPFQIMAKNDAQKCAIKLTNRRNEGLTKRLYKMVRGLTDSSLTRKLQIKVDGAKEPIDLLVSRYTYKERVEYDGHYPAPAKIFEALLSAKSKFDAEQAQPNHSGPGA